MGKSVNDAVIDAALQYLEDNGERICFCSAEPTTYTEAVTTYKLADVDIDGTDFTGPVDGDTSGRKTTVNAQSGVTVDSSGTVNHAAIVDVTGTTLLAVTTITGQVVTAGNTLDSSAFDIEISDPV